MTTTENKVVPLKLTERKKEKTIKYVLQQLIDDMNDDKEVINDSDFSIGLLTFVTNTGISVVPLKNCTYLEYIGLLEASKTLMTDELLTGYMVDEDE